METSRTNGVDRFRIWGGFLGNKNVTQLSVPDDAIYIGASACADCINLENITISENVISIGRFAFSGCKKLQSIHIPYSVKTIDQSSFLGCIELKIVSGCEQVTLVNSQAFKGCSSLESMTLPRLNELSHEMFSGCSSLTKLHAPIINNSDLTTNNPLTGCVKLGLYDDNDILVPELLRFDKYLILAYTLGNETNQAEVNLNRIDDVFLVHKIASELEVDMDFPMLYEEFGRLGTCGGRLMTLGFINRLRNALYKLKEKYNTTLYEGLLEYIAPNRISTNDTLWI